MNRTVFTLAALAWLTAGACHFLAWLGFRHRPAPSGDPEVERRGSTRETGAPRTGMGRPRG